MTFLSLFMVVMQIHKGEVQRPQEDHRQSESSSLVTSVANRYLCYCKKPT